MSHFENTEPSPDTLSDHSRLAQGLGTPSDTLRCPDPQQLCERALQSPEAPRFLDFHSCPTRSLRLMLHLSASVMRRKICRMLARILSCARHPQQASRRPPIILPHPISPDQPRRPPAALALLTVALPLASPTPRPLVPLDRNIGAFRSMSGTMKKRTCEPRMYTWSRCETRPSRAVTVMSFSWMFILSSAAKRSVSEGEGERKEEEEVESIESGEGGAEHADLRGACRGRLGRRLFRGLRHGPE